MIPGDLYKLIGWPTDEHDRSGQSMAVWADATDDHNADTVSRVNVGDIVCCLGPVDMSMMEQPFAHQPYRVVVVRSGAVGDVETHASGSCVWEHVLEEEKNGNAAR